MSTYNTKFQFEQGGNVLNVATGAQIKANGTQASAIADYETPATATAEEIATKQNAILAALRGIGLIAAE